MIKPLTSLRFLFALLVFCHHSDFLHQDKYLSQLWLVKRVFAEGYVGVSFFYVLSGFILAYTYQTKLADKVTSTRDFLAARFARVYPMHIFTLLLVIPSFILHIDKPWYIHWPIKLVANVFLVQSFVPDPTTYYSFNGVSWSISDEMFFYLMFPLLVLGIVKFGKKMLLPLLAMCIIIPVLVHFNKNPYNDFLFFINPFFRIVDFGLGIMLFNIYRRINVQAVSAFTGSIMEVSSVIILMIFFELHPYVAQNYRFDSYYWLPMCLLIFSFAFQKGVLSKLISYPVFIVLGEISFSFYLLHQIVMRYFFTVNTRVHFLDKELPIFFLILTVAIILSYLAHKYIELPANKYLKGKLMTKRKTTQFVGQMQ